MPACQKCGSPLKPDTKFCGECGAPNKAAETKKSASKKASTPQPAQRERLNYYSPPTGRAVPSAPLPFLGNQPIQPMAQQFQAPPMQYQPQPMPTQPQYTPAPAYAAAAQPPQYQPPFAQYQPAPQMGAEQTLGVVLFRRMKSMGRYDAYAAVCTSQQIVFAQLTAQMLNDAAQQARDKAKAEGKGFWGQWGDQLRGTFGYGKKYLTMPTQAILAETPGNFAIQNMAIIEVKFHLKGGSNDVHNQQRHFEIEIKTAGGNFRYDMDENGDFINTLKNAYGQKVTMPFGYHYNAIDIRF